MSRTGNYKGYLEDKKQKTRKDYEDIELALVEYKYFLGFIPIAKTRMVKAKDHPMGQIMLKIYDELLKESEID